MFKCFFHLQDHVAGESNLVWLFNRCARPPRHSAKDWLKLNLLFRMGQPHLFNLFSSFRTNLVACRIRTWVVGVEGKSAYHYATTTANLTCRLPNLKLGNTIWIVKLVHSLISLMQALKSNKRLLDWCPSTLRVSSSKSASVPAAKTENCSTPKNNL